MKKMWEFGLIDKWKALHMNNVSDPCEVKNVKAKGIAVEDLKFVFILGGGFLLGSLLVFLCELIVYNSIKPLVTYFS